MKGVMPLSMGLKGSGWPARICDRHVEPSCIGSSLRRSHFPHGVGRARLARRLAVLFVPCGGCSGCCFASLTAWYTEAVCVLLAAAHEAQHSLVHHACSHVTGGTVTWLQLAAPHDTEFVEYPHCLWVPPVGQTAACWVPSGCCDRGPRDGPAWGTWSWMAKGWQWINQLVKL